MPDMFSEPTVVASPVIGGGPTVEEGEQALDAMAQRRADVAVRRQDGLGQTFDLLRRALDSGVSVEAIKELKTLVNEEQDRAAAREFAEALAAFQDECPPIPRTRQAEIVTRSGGKFGYAYADFEQIVETARPHLRQHGLSFSFDSRVDPGAMLTATGTLRHVNGHSITSSFTLPTSSASAMSDQQRFGAALTFAKRQVLISVLGLSLTDPDPEGEADPTTITEDQANTIDTLMQDTKANLAKFLEYFGVERIADLRATDYAKAVAKLESKRGKP